MTARCRNIDRAAGFALVDLLMAIVVAGLAGSVLIGLARFAEYSRVETTHREREHEGVLVLERMLRALVERAPSVFPGPSPKSSISGDEHEIQVMSNGLPAIGLPQLSAFHLRRDVGRAGSDAVLSWVDDARQVHRKILAQDIAELTFAYLPRVLDRLKGTISGTQAWQPRWHADDGQLSALRLVIRFKQEAMPWIVVIPIEADLSVACLRNSQQAGCAPRGQER